jgi:hypothetical protein
VTSKHFDCRFLKQWEEDHIPGTQNFQFCDCFNPDMTYKSEADFLQALGQTGLDVEDKG